MTSKCIGIYMMLFHNILYYNGRNGIDFGVKTNILEIRGQKEGTRNMHFPDVLTIMSLLVNKFWGLRLELFWNYGLKRDLKQAFSLWSYLYCSKNDWVSWYTMTRMFWLQPFMNKEPKKWQLQFWSIFYPVSSIK